MINAKYFSYANKTSHSKKLQPYKTARSIQYSAACIMPFKNFAGTFTIGADLNPT
jgi:hypothetical protein